MRRRAHHRGTTLVEILISLAVVLVGMLGLFRVLGSSMSGSSTASRQSQAQVRAITILESIRHSPQSALNCLAGNLSANWSSCEQLCLNALTVPKYDACIYTLARFSIINSPVDGGGQTVDRSSQSYFLDSGSAVKMAGANNNVYDIDVRVGWNDDNTQSTAAPGYHTVRLRTGVFPVSP